MRLSDIEEEVMFLKANKEIIDSMVNFAMLTLHGSDPDSSVLFETSMHQRFFNIVLVDFASHRQEGTSETEFIPWCVAGDLGAPKI